MQNENRKSGIIKTQKINSEAIVKYTMQNNLLQNLILNLNKDSKNQSKTETEYNELIESFALDKTTFFRKSSAGKYTQFIGKIVDYQKVKDFIKKTFVYIFNGRDSFWITINVYNNEIKYNFIKDLSAFSRKIVTYKNPHFKIDNIFSKPWIKKSFANILEEMSHELQYERVDFIPTHKNIDSGSFNMFTSFKAKKIYSEIDEKKLIKYCGTLNMFGAKAMISYTTIL